MAAKRPVVMDSVRQVPASRLPVPAQHHKTATASSQAGKKTKTVTNEEDVPQTELEILDSLRCRMEKSVDAFIKARKQLEEILPAEGSREQGPRLPGAKAGLPPDADLKTELKRHRELTSRAASAVKTNKDPNNHRAGPVERGNSYQFLKSIMS